MERRMRPIAGSLHVTMLDRVVVDVIEMMMPIFLIADDMFPIAALPDAAFATPLTINGNSLISHQ